MCWSFLDRTCNKVYRVETYPETNSKGLTFVFIVKNAVRYKHAWDCFRNQTKSYLQPAVAIAQVVASGISTDSGEKGATVEEQAGGCVFLSKCCGYHQAKSIFIAFF